MSHQQHHAFLYLSLSLFFAEFSSESRKLNLENPSNNQDWLLLQLSLGCFIFSCRLLTFLYIPQTSVGFTYCVT